MQNSSAKSGRFPGGGQAVDNPVHKRFKKSKDFCSNTTPWVVSLLATQDMGFLEGR